ncbi:hypothetical protein ACN20G_27590 (plasmid) [Streptomyces sp. BI20]|uniref:hypothetical protein n=1 Tax=Streptomyces sp. BI20 TaxID=3403460 RepID=UPI003C77BB8D
MRNVWRAAALAAVLVGTLGASVPALTAPASAASGYCADWAGKLPGPRATRAVVWSGSVWYTRTYQGSRDFGRKQLYNFDRRGALQGSYCVTAGQSYTGYFTVQYEGEFKEAGMLNPAKKEMTFVEVADSTGGTWWVESKDVKDGWPDTPSAAAPAPAPPAPPAEQGPQDTWKDTVRYRGATDGEAHVDRDVTPGTCVAVEGGGTKALANLTESAVTGYPEPDCAGRGETRQPKKGFLKPEKEGTVFHSYRLVPAGS